MTEKRCITVVGVLWLAAVSGCAPGIVPPDQGVAVGNPGNLRVDLAPIEGVSFARTRIEVGELSLEACDGTLVSVVSNLELDRLSEQAVEIPRGSWCGVHLDEVWLETTVRFEEDDEAAVEALGLGWERIVLSGPVGSQPSDDLAIWFGAPDWLPVEELARWLYEEDALDEGDDSDDVAEILLEESRLLIDADSDGPDTGDEVVGRLDIEALEAEDEEDEEADRSDSEAAERSGCGGGEDDGSRALGLLCFGLLGARRRMRRAGVRTASSGDDRTSSPPCLM